MATDIRRAGRRARRSGRPGHRLQLRQGAPLGPWRKRGARSQAIGPSRGGQTTKVHALTDSDGRPYVFLLTPGNIADIAVAPALVAAMPPGDSMLADKGYDANALRALLASRGTTPIIPNKACRKVALPFDAEAYKQRNVIERMFCRLKDFRRIATRYDKLARNFLAAICIAATVIWWLD